VTRAVQGAARQQLHVDWTRCDGHGVCAALLPERITQDDWGYPVLHRDTFDAAELADARRAIAACPALALRLERARERGR
jgi:ferredoxin